MTNLQAHMPVKAHAYKYHNELEEIMPQERAQKIYETTHQYHSFYTRLSLVHMGLRKLGKADVKKTTTLLSCIKSKKTYHLMTFPPKIESTHRQKENKHQTLLNSKKPHLYVRSSFASTIVHSFTCTRTIDTSSTIENVHMPKIPSPKLINFLLTKICPQPRQLQ